MRPGSLQEGAWFIARSAVAMLALSANGVLSAASAPTAPPQIPALQWEERSDWINVKTDIAPAAIGDGQADDTVAIQKALGRSARWFGPLLSAGHLPDYRSARR